jgi:hypothetical protein
MFNTDQYSILNTAKLGMEFEFYVNNSNNVEQSLSNFLKKNIYFYHEQPYYFEPDTHNFLIRPDLTGGKDMFELKTGMLVYNEARLVLINMLSWIKKNGYTTHECSLNITLSWDTDKNIERKNLISNLNVIKFILQFNEDQVYNLFPERKNSKYAKSIKNIIPRDENYLFNYNFINSHNFYYPRSKYYGINFYRITQDILEYRYIGGEDYEYKADSIIFLINNFILKTWSVCNNPNLTDIDKKYLKEILDKNQYLIDILNDYTKLNQYFNDITLMVDLQEVAENIRLKWDRIKYKIVDLISLNKLKAGVINYDSELGKLQIKDGKFDICYELNDVDLIDCELNGNIKNCELFTCQVENAYIDKCYFFNDTQIKESIILNSFISNNTQIVNSFVAGINTLIKGSMDSGIIKDASIDAQAEIENVEFINTKQIE